MLKPGVHVGLLPNPGPRTQTGLWSVFYLFVKIRKFENNVMKFRKVEFINLEDFSLFRQSVALPSFDIKIKMLTLKLFSALGISPGW